MKKILSHDVPPEHHYLKDHKEFAVQIASDLHLEFFNEKFPIPQDIIVPNAPVLALLGDIGVPSLPSYAKFLQLMAEKFELVLVLPGNHEYYQKNQEGAVHQTHEQVANEMKKICATHPKLVYFDNHAVKIAGVRVIGATLWTHTPIHAYGSAGAINDYNMIYKESTSEKGKLEKITPEDTSLWHSVALYHIANQIEESMRNGEKDCVVFTHHAPSLLGTSDPQYEGPFNNKMSHAFGTSLEYLFKNYGKNGNSNVNTWCFGHTHYSSDEVKFGTRVVSNQRGYMGSKAVATYKNNYVITLQNDTDKKKKSWFSS